MTEFVRRIALGAAVTALFSTAALAAGITYEGGEGPGKGKHIVFVTGDEEYRSEEGMPQLAKILAVRHGFKCTVLFSINKETGEIDPGTLDNIPGLEALRDADLMVLFTRFRELPDADMKHIVDYTNSGRPIIALRTATHPFFYRENPDSPYAKWTWNNPDPDFQGGYGRQVLGETWVSHYGKHGTESTRGEIVPEMKDHPIVQGCEDIWGDTDVYGINSLTGDSQPLVNGIVLTGMNPDDPPGTEKTEKQPIAWIKTWTGESGTPARVFTTTMGASRDLLSEGLRRLLVNAAYWCTGLEEQIPPRANVDIVGEYNPTPFGFNEHQKGLKPEDHALAE
ncbi:MAG: ThuA domain-containing protein [Candidatus Hydrogenedentes bacterium]|nr:ThuA domain-containing protein [Candidatus Hydrogenedentota bacterium]